MTDRRNDGGPAFPRPTGSNADEWDLFLSEHPNAFGFLAVQIAEAIEDAETAACERAIDRMGWPEINAFHSEFRRGQSVYEDAGGFLLRAIRKLFGLQPRDGVVTYRDAADAMVAERGKK